MSQEQSGAAPITRYGKGDVILRQGDDNTSIYKVLSGSVSLYTSYDGKRKAHLGQHFTQVVYPGCFGETSMLSGSPSIYTAIADEPTVLMRISEDGLEPFLRNDRQNALSIMHSLAEKLAATHTLLCSTWHSPEEEETGPAAGEAEADYYKRRAERLEARARTAARKAAQAETAAQRARDEHKEAELREAERKAREAQEATVAAAAAQKARQAAKEAAERKAREAQAAAEAAAAAQRAAEEAAWITAQAQAAAEEAAYAQAQAAAAADAAAHAQVVARVAQVQAGVMMPVAPQAPRVREEPRPDPGAGLFLPGHKGYPGVTHPEYRNYVFEKRLNCPNCKRSMVAQRILHSKLQAAPEMGPPRYDLRSAYQDFQIEWYTLTTCPHCRFTAPFSAFAEPKGLKRDRYVTKLEELGPRVRMDFEAERDLDFVFAQHYLGLLCARAFSDVLLRTGQIWMNLSWLYEDVKEDGLRRMAEAKALEIFRTAYAASHMNPAQEQRLCMMIAAMSLRAGELDDARAWAYKVRMNRAGKANYIKLAEDLVDDIRVQKRLKEGANEGD